MQDTTPATGTRVALITGAAHRIGAAIARELHAQGMNIVLHYHRSQAAAQALQQALDTQRADSCALLQGDLLDGSQLAALAERATACWGRLDALINNASTFYPTAVGETAEAQWNDLLGTNLKAPYFLAQAAAAELARRHGCIVNIVDIHAERPLKGHAVYSIAKAGLVMLTRALACELGPQVRVNAVAPGAILWPEHALEESVKQRIIARTFLKRQGDPNDIARAVRYLVCEAGYVSGQVLTVDGGRSLNG